MERDLLSAAEAARRLGISRETLYQWLADSNAGTLVIRGQSVTIDYFQSGRRGQGRIQIDADEVERIIELMRVRPCVQRRRKPPTQRRHYPGIYVELGDIDD